MKTQIQKPHRKTLRAAARKAFSLVELLVVIAVIGIIAAIAIPNIAGITGSATTAKSQRNAQNVVSVYSAAIAAGAPAAASRDAGITAITGTTGMSPTTGAFSGKKFNATMDSNELIPASKYIGWDASNSALTYVSAGGETDYAP